MIYLLTVTVASQYNKFFEDARPRLRGCGVFTPLQGLPGFSSGNLVWTIRFLPLGPFLTPLEEV